MLVIHVISDVIPKTQEYGIRTIYNCKSLKHCNIKHFSMAGSYECNYDTDTQFTSEQLNYILRDLRLGLLGDDCIAMFNADRGHTIILNAVHKHDRVKGKDLFQDKNTICLMKASKMIVHQSEGNIIIDPTIEQLYNHYELDHTYNAYTLYSIAEKLLPKYIHA